MSSAGRLLIYGSSLNADIYLMSTCVLELALRLHRALVFFVYFPLSWRADLSSLAVVL